MFATIHINCLHFVVRSDTLLYEPHKNADTCSDSIKFWQYHIRICKCTFWLILNTYHFVVRRWEYPNIVREIASVATRQPSMQSRWLNMMASTISYVEVVLKRNNVSFEQVANSSAYRVHIKMQWSDVKTFRADRLKCSLYSGSERNTGHHHWHAEWNCFRSIAWRACCCNICT
jgi:hypothetical protein